MTEQSQVAPTDVGSRMREQLGSAAAEWASYRLMVGEYYYRAYNPAVSPRGSYLTLALQELDRVRLLDPTNAPASRLETQILMNQNVLGLPQDLDVRPDFERYTTAYTAWGQLVFGTFQSGIDALLAANNLQTMVDQLKLQLEQIDGTIAVASIEHSGALIAQQAAQKDEQQAKSRVDDLNGQIQQALTAMNNQTVSIGDILGTVGAIASAVIAVAGAIPSGGASLLALVPDAIALSKDVITNLPEIAKELFKSEQKDLDRVKQEYKKVDKDYTEIVGAGRAVVSLIGLIGKLTAVTTPDNSKYLDLVRQGVEASHTLLLSTLHVQQASLAVQALQTKIDRATGLKGDTVELAQRQQVDGRILRNAAITIIRAAQLRRDSLLTFSFLAERSLEIYTLRNEAGSLFLDSGFVHPDVDRDFEEGVIRDVALAAQYQLSWTRFLSPVQMQTDYISYFTQQQLDMDSRRLSFTDAETIARFIADHEVDFLLDLQDLPPNHYEAKIQGVAVGLVGATSPSSVVSCEVTHGQRYEQTREDRSAVIQLLRPHTATVQGSTMRLELAGVSFQPGNPLTAPQILAFWGRGVGGSWSVAVTDSELALHKVDLSAVTEIQVWISYQFFLESS